MDISKNEKVMFKKFIHFGLLLIGGSTKINKKVKYFYHTFALSCYLFLIVGNFITFINISGKLYKFEACTRLLISIGLTMLYPYCWVYRHQIAKLFSKYDENSPDYMGDDEMKTTAKMFLKTFTHQWIFYIGTMIINPLIAGVFLKNSREIDSYEFLYLYSCGSRAELAVMKYCFERGSFGNFILNDIMESIFISYQAFIVQAGQLIITAAIQGVEAKLHIYDDLLKTSIEKVKMMDKSDRNDLLEFHAIIKYQQSISRHVMELKSLSKMCVMVHMIFLYIIILLTILAVSSRGFTSTYLDVRWLSTASYVLLIHYKFCKGLFEVGYVNEHFSSALLEFPWYERSVQFQKYYLMVLKLYQKDYPFTVWGLYEVNLKLFAINVNRLYSIVNLVLLKYRQ